MIALFMAEAQTWKLFLVRVLTKTLCRQVGLPMLSEMVWQTLLQARKLTRLLKGGTPRLLWSLYWMVMMPRLFRWRDLARLMAKVAQL